MTVTERNTETYWDFQVATELHRKDRQLSLAEAQGIGAIQEWQNFLRGQRDRSSVEFNADDEYVYIYMIIYIYMITHTYIYIYVYILYMYI